MPLDPFDVRRHKDPQGLIDDLVQQTTRQARAIYDLGQEIARLKKAIEAAEKKKGG